MTNALILLSLVSLMKLSVSAFDFADYEDTEVITFTFDFAPFGFIFFLIIIVIFIIAGKYAFNMRRKNGEGVQGHLIPQTSFFVSVPNRTQEIEYILKGHDPDFYAYNFLSFTKMLYYDY